MTSGIMTVIQRERLERWERFCGAKIGAFKIYMYNELAKCVFNSLTLTFNSNNMNSNSISNKILPHHPFQCLPCAYLKKCEAVLSYKGGAAHARKQMSYQQCQREQRIIWSMKVQPLLSECVFFPYKWHGHLILWKKKKEKKWKCIKTFSRTLTQHTNRLWRLTHGEGYVGVRCQVCIPESFLTDSRCCHGGCMYGYSTHFHWTKHSCLFSFFLSFLPMLWVLPEVPGSATGQLSAVQLTWTKQVLVKSAQCNKTFNQLWT